MEPEVDYDDNDPRAWRNACGETRLLGELLTEWREKLEHAVALRKVVQDSNKAFEVETLSADTFLMPLYANASQGPAWEQNNTFTGKVTCSVPFSKFGVLCAPNMQSNKRHFLASSHSRRTKLGCCWLSRRCLDWVPTRS